MKVTLALLLTVSIAFPLVQHRARSAEIDQVQIPETLWIDGKTLHLNGFGLRTYSVLDIHIYVVSLYLEHPNTNPEEIIRSLETKLLIVTFKHDVSAETARTFWREGLWNNCLAPCRLDPNDVEKFLARVPAMHKGDNYTVLFGERAALVRVGGQLVGTISSPDFAKGMLAVFLGPKPALPKLKADLLRGHG